MCALTYEKLKLKKCFSNHYYDHCTANVPALMFSRWPRSRRQLLEARFGRTVLLRQLTRTVVVCAFLCFLTLFSAVTFTCPLCKDQQWPSRIRLGLLTGLGYLPSLEMAASRSSSKLCFSHFSVSELVPLLVTSPSLVLYSTAEFTMIWITKDPFWWVLCYATLELGLVVIETITWCAWSLDFLWRWSQETGCVNSV